MTRLLENFARSRGVVVPVLVIGSFLIATTVSIAVGVERPYPGVALGSGLLLGLERAVAVWVIVLLLLVVGDQALQGKLPDEIGGRGVRYVAQGQLDAVAGQAAEAGADVVGRLDELEKALMALGWELELARQRGSDPLLDRAMRRYDELSRMGRR